MKTIRNLLIIIFTFVAFAASAYAQSPREELQQMVEQLQKSPNDNALREKIIRLATSIKPALVIPEEANRAFVKGNVFQKEAKDASGVELAISAYQEALRAAPWWSDAYYNLSMAQTSANHFGEAIASISLYMASVPPGSAEARDAQNRIYAIEAKSEMASKQAAAQAAAAIAMANRLEGTWARYEMGWGDDGRLSRRYRFAVSIKQDAGHIWHVEGNEYSGYTNNVREVQLKGADLQFISDHTITSSGEVFTASLRHTSTVASDGRTIKIVSELIPLTSSEAARLAEGPDRHWAKGSVYVYEKE